MGEKFYFIFGEQPNTKVYVDEPIGYRSVPFVLKAMHGATQAAR